MPAKVDLTTSDGLERALRHNWRGFLPSRMRAGRRASQYREPGPVETDLWLGYDGVAATVTCAGGVRADDVATHAAAECSIGRFSYPVADLVLLLASDRAANITGSDFVIDGELIKTLRQRAVPALKTPQRHCRT